MRTSTYLAVSMVGVLAVVACGEAFSTSTDADLSGSDAAVDAPGTPDAADDGGPCEKRTCSAANRECGKLEQCGQTTTCAECPSGQSCSASYKCECKPKTCAELGYACGRTNDGCNNPIACGLATNDGCESGKFCDQGKCKATPCVPKSCAELKFECGKAVDNCNKDIDCGDKCVSPQTCGGGGQANICGCKPKTCGQDFVCGTNDDGCGNKLACGDCAKGQECRGGKSCCTNDGCSDRGYTCGAYKNGCGDLLKCGDAPGAVSGNNSKCPAGYPRYYDCVESFLIFSSAKEGAENPFADGRNCQVKGRNGKGVANAWCCDR